MIETRTCIYDFHFHLVFVTKYRKSIFNTVEKQNELKDLLISFSKKNGTEIEAIEIMDDHVHLVISFPPKLAPSSIVKSFKGASAREWFKLHPEDKKKLYKGHLWSPSFFMRTVGVVSREIVMDYVRNQHTKEPRRY
jgi:transposase IS200-family protein